MNKLQEVIAEMKKKGLNKEARLLSRITAMPAPSWESGPEDIDLSKIDKNDALSVMKAIIAWYDNNMPRVGSMFVTKALRDWIDNDCKTTNKENKDAIDEALSIAAEELKLGSIAKLEALFREAVKKDLLEYLPKKEHKPNRDQSSDILKDQDKMHDIIRNIIGYTERLDDALILSVTMDPEKIFKVDGPIDNQIKKIQLEINKLVDLKNKMLLF